MIAGDLDGRQGRGLKIETLTCDNILSCLPHYTYTPTNTDFTDTFFVVSVGKSSGYHTESSLNVTILYACSTLGVRPIIQYVAKVKKYFDLSSNPPTSLFGHTDGMHKHTLPLMWINHTTRERKSVFMFHLWGREVTSSIYFHFKTQCSAPYSPSGCLFAATLKKNMINILH